MKKSLFILAIIAILVIAGCSNGNNNASNVSNNATSPSADTPAAAPAPAPAPEAPKTDFPKKTIEMIVPYAAGGSADVVARILADAVSKYLPNNQNVVIVNKAGGSGVIGATELFTAKPDGYTLAHMPTTILTITSSLGNATFSYDDFQPIMRTVSDPILLTVKADSQWKTYEDWLAYVKANPGKFAMGVGSKGGAQHLGVEAMIDALGIDINVVGFDGGAPLATALLGGHVDGGIMHSADIKAQVEEGNFLPIVNMGNTKDQPHYKDIPLIQEKDTDVNANISMGIFAPKDLPEAELEILHDAFKKAFEDPDAQAKLAQLGNNLSYGESSAYEEQIKAEFETNFEVMKKIGLIQ